MTFPHVADKFTVEVAETISKEIGPSYNEAYEDKYAYYTACSKGPCNPQDINGPWRHSYRGAAEDVIAKHIKPLQNEIDALRVGAHHDREQLAQWIMAKGFATGHGDTIGDLLKELDCQYDEYVAGLQGNARTPGATEVCAACVANGDTESQQWIHDVGTKWGTCPHDYATPGEGDTNVLYPNCSIRNAMK